MFSLPEHILVENSFKGEANALQGPKDLAVLSRCLRLDPYVAECLKYMRQKQKRDLRGGRGIL
mgnify:CR=1 FL=1